MDREGTLLLNGDEPLLWNQRGKLAPKTLYFAIRNKDADFYADEIEQTGTGQRFTIRGGFSMKCEIFAKGEHNVYNALCAASLGHFLGMDSENIASGLLNFQNAPMRQNIYEKNGMIIIDDCYNANPDSMKAAIGVLSSMEGRKIAVLGDMLELGSYSDAAHEEIAGLAAQRGISYLFLKGPAMGRAAAKAAQGGMDPAHVIWKETDEELARAAKGILQEGDRVLFKGSRGMKMERVLTLMLEECKNA
jgi:UDP-N-acetylmuramoyl-tripeptide--D-alanyl-D-alanine ligase